MISAYENFCVIVFGRLYLLFTKLREVSKKIPVVYEMLFSVVLAIEHSLHELRIKK